MYKLLVLVGAATLAASSTSASTPASSHVNSLDASHSPQEGQNDAAKPDTASSLIPAQPVQAQADQCRDSITRARSVSDQSPVLERGTASPKKPYAIYAVHREQDGCSVMVMMGNREDIRPLPAPMEEPLGVIPAELGQ